jgi:hypothetical protein
MNTDILQQDIQTLLEFFSKNTYRAGVDTQIVSFPHISHQIKSFKSQKIVLMMKTMFKIRFTTCLSLKSGRICQFRIAFYL